ncbi:MAG: TIGR02300 family protein [Paracoccaceae bacterium]
MPNEEWGVKRLCPKCATRFYDLQKDPMTCPACAEEFDLASLLNPGKSTTSKAKAKKDTKVAEPVIDDVEDVLDDDENTSTDDTLLDDDDDDTVTLEEVADVPAEKDED